MNNSVMRIALDIHDTASQVTLDVKQGDTGRELRCLFTENGKPYMITEECYAVFTAIKPDGNIIYNACVIEGNTVIYTLTAQTVAASGSLNCEFKLYGGDGCLITSPRFTLNVNACIYTDGDVVEESGSEISALTQLVSRTSELVHEVETSLENGDFKGDPGYSPVKGKDYFTEEEIEDIESDVKEDISAELIAHIVIPTPEYTTGGYTSASLTAVKAACDAILAAENEGKSVFIYHASAYGGFYPMGYTRKSGVWFFSGFDALEVSEAVNGDEPLYVTRLIYDYNNNKITAYSRTAIVGDLGDWAESWEDYEAIESLSTIGAIHIACASVLSDAKAYAEKLLLIDTEAVL